MTEKKEQVTIDEIAVGNMISIETVVNILIAKGILTKEEIIDEV